MKYPGLSLAYGDWELLSLGVVTVDLPSSELIPLLRSVSPVARMLRQRGLWTSMGPKR